MGLPMNIYIEETREQNIFWEIQFYENNTLDENFMKALEGNKQLRICGFVCITYSNSSFSRNLDIWLSMY